MPNPKWKHSKTRRRKRRTHYKIEAANVVKCPNCGADNLPHHVCGECGFYHGRIMIAPKTAHTAGTDGPDVIVED